MEEATGIKEVRNTVLWTYVVDDLNGEEIVGTFCEKELQKTNEKEFRIEKAIKKKGNKLYVKWKGDNISFNSCIDRKDRINAPTNLSNLRIKVDKLDVDKSVPVPVNLVKLSDVVKMMLLKRLNIVNQLKKTDYNTKINEIENKISDHDYTKYVTTKEFNKLTEENFTVRFFYFFELGIKSCLGSCIYYYYRSV